MYILLPTLTLGMAEKMSPTVGIGENSSSSADCWTDESCDLLPVPPPSDSEEAAAVDFGVIADDASPGGASPARGRQQEVINVVIQKKRKIIYGRLV